MRLRPSNNRKRRLQPKHKATNCSIYFLTKQKLYPLNTFFSYIKTTCFLFTKKKLIKNFEFFAQL